MKFPDKKYKKGDIVRLNPIIVNYNWYKPDKFVVVSYYLDYYDKYQKFKSTHESKVKELKIRNKNNIHGISTNVRSLKDGRYTKYSEIWLKIDKQETRNKIIDLIIN